ncbi:MAG: DNA polymerase III subunit gamma/tau [Parcubacteria group bacterium]|nr:DNA polymerase III subunit gamma/tau [Parcubacteria group bacterium]
MLYRKYRPKKFSELIGQEHLIKTLQGALMVNQVAHAYLFAGPRGTGKTSVARILAKAVNCVDYQLEVESGRLKVGDSLEPCNKCHICSDFNHGSAIDLIEIDAASNRGIDEIRNLKESVNFAPNICKYKVYLIDEVHMLTKEAFNALLKTLEEPPAHVIFILATTDSEKVPDTIKSRTQFFRFKHILNSLMVQRLITIAKSENIKVPEEALNLIAQSGNGSMRDAESNFSKLVSFTGQNVSLSDVQEVLGLVPFNFVAEFIACLSAKKKNEAIKYINHAYESGVEMDQFLKSITDFFRMLLIAKMSPASLVAYKNELPGEHMQLIANYAVNFDPMSITKALRIFLNAGQYLRTSPIPQLPLELAVVEFLDSQ